MKNPDQSINDLFQKARAETPFGEARDYGFATRLRASVKNGEPRTLDFFTALCWRVSMVCLPVVIPAMIAIAFSNHLGMTEALGSLSFFTYFFAFEFSVL